MFRNKTQTINDPNNRLPEFNFLGSDDIYMDSACQSIRPQPVINAMNEYYQTYNACGGRVKYKWGQKVDLEINDTRQLVINYLGLSSKDYVCSFTLNTTYGLNLVLGQLPTGYYNQIITSEIEHNSVFLPTITLAKRLGIARKVLIRNNDGSLNYSHDDLNKSIIVVSSTSNIDGRQLINIKQLINEAHKVSGIVIIDAAQTMAHYHEILSGCGADAICFSAHKMYAASLGVIVIRINLLQSLNINFIGGGMVSCVRQQDYTILPDEMASWLEPGLQSYAEIISLKKSIEWLTTVKPNGLKPSEYVARISAKLYDGLSQIPSIVMINHQPSSVISLYSKNIDSHRLAIFLSASGIMVRSGYFCCHYYLLEILKLPPLVRFSIGIHTTENDIDKLLEIMKKLTKD